LIDIFVSCQIGESDTQSAVLNDHFGHVIGMKLHCRLPGIHLFGTHVDCHTARRRFVMTAWHERGRPARIPVDWGRITVRYGASCCLQNRPHPARDSIRLLLDPADGLNTSSISLAGTPAP